MTSTQKWAVLPLAVAVAALLHSDLLRSAFCGVGLRSAVVPRRKRFALCVDAPRVFGPLPEKPPLDDSGEMRRCGALLDELLAEEKLEQACAALRELPCRSTAKKAEFLGLLKECLVEKDSERARRILDHMWENPGLEPDAACMGTASEACLKAGEREAALELLQEVQSWGLSRAAPAFARFQLAPWIKWDQDFRKAGCSARNELEWMGDGPAPSAPNPPCWLIPTQDPMAETLAQRSCELLRLGWKVFVNPPALVRTLRNKADLYAHAAKLGLEEFMPKRYAGSATATFPCILKAAIGTWGSDMCIARSAQEADAFLAKRPGADMLLQELVPGRFELSTTLLVIDGSIFDAVCTLYEYDREEYVWPDANEVGHSCQSVQEQHLKTMEAFLPGYTGIINFNYKLRACGKMSIFETNPRVGADFAFDVPRPRVRHLFEKLDAVLG